MKLLLLDEENCLILKTNKSKEIIDDVLAKNYIGESYSPYVSPIVLLKNKNGADDRLCIDYRELNRTTVRDHYSTPLTDDQLDSLKDKHCFTSLDLKMGSII